MVEKIGNEKIYDTRLSNGPIESLNRKIKDLKRLGRGFRNFEHFRNRFLYATRSVPVLNGITNCNPVLYLEEDDFYEYSCVKKPTFRTRKPPLIGLITLNKK